MAFFSSCGEKKAKDGRTDTPTSGTIEFYADESLSPIIDEERTQFEFEFPKAKLKPIYSDEVTGLQMIKDFKTTLLFTTRHLEIEKQCYSFSLPYRIRWIGFYRQQEQPRYLYNGKRHQACADRQGDKMERHCSWL
mgnify:CR=1 FL=1